MARLDNPFDTYLDEDLSRFSEYKTDKHVAYFLFRYITKAINMHNSM